MADLDAVRGAGVPDRPPAAPTPPAAAESGGGVMTLVDHLTELRSRLLKCIVAIAVGSAIGFVAAPTIRRWLVQPLPADHQQLIVLGPGDAFAITLRIAVAVGLILA